MSRHNTDLRRSSYFQRPSKRLTNHTHTHNDSPSTAPTLITGFTFDNNLTSSSPSHEDTCWISAESGYIDPSISNTMRSVSYDDFPAVFAHPSLDRNSHSRSSTADDVLMDLDDTPVSTFENMTSFDQKYPPAGLSGLNSSSPLALSDLDESSHSQDLCRTNRDAIRLESMVVCDLCSATFRTLYSLTRHRRTKHKLVPAGSKIWICNFQGCLHRNKKWTWFDNLKQHVTLVHGREYADKLDRSGLIYDPIVHGSFEEPRVKTHVRKKFHDTASTSARNMSSIRTGTETEETSHTLAAELRNPDYAAASTFSPAQAQSTFSSFLRARCEGYDEWFSDFLNQFLTINDVDHIIRKHMQPSVDLLGERTASLLLNSRHDRTQTIAALVLAESVNQISVNIVSHAADQLGQVNVLTSLGSPLPRPNLSSSDERQYSRCSTEPSKSEIPSSHIQTHFQADPHHEKGSSSGAADESPTSYSDKGKKRVREESSSDTTMPSSQIEKPEIEPKKQKRAQVSEQDRLFACHCQKRFPERYRLHNVEGTSCFGTFRSTNDVKQHLRRDHTVPDYYCVRCYTEFSQPNLRDDHLRSCPDEAVRLQSPFTYKMTRDMAGRIAAQRRVRGTLLTDEDIWFQIWDVLYPGHPCPASPYQDELWTILEAQQAAQEAAYRLANEMVRDAVREVRQTAHHTIQAAVTAFVTRIFCLLELQDSTILLGLINACHQQRPDILTPEDTNSIVHAVDNATQLAYSPIHLPMMPALATGSQPQTIMVSLPRTTTTSQEPAAGSDATNTAPDTNSSPQVDTSTLGTSMSWEVRPILPASQIDSSPPIRIHDLEDDSVDFDDKVLFVGEGAYFYDNTGTKSGPPQSRLSSKPPVPGSFHYGPLS